MTGKKNILQRLPFINPPLSWQDYINTCKLDSIIRKKLLITALWFKFTWV